MLRLAVVFLVIALIAAICGFGFVANYSYVGPHMAIAEAAGEWAKIILVIFFVLALLSFMVSPRRRTRLEAGTALLPRSL